MLSKSIRLSLGLLLSSTALVGAVAATQVHAQAPATAGKVIVKKVTVHGKSLEGNLEGNSADRSVTIYLPPDYETNPTKRYPVVYGLHGYSVNDEIWSKEIGASGSIDAAYAKGLTGLILVLPSTQTLHNGSMYSSSVTTGDWEGFITKDLVEYIDSNYRTLAKRESRGLMGHSMGGYGTTRIGMKYPEVYSALYIIAPCCMGARGAPPAAVLDELRAIKDPQATTSMGFMHRATLAVASAWSPNPKNPPLYVDLPTTGDMNDPIIAQWAANAPLAMVDQYMFNLRQYTAIALDVGDKDGLVKDTTTLHHKLMDNGVHNTLEIHDGDHVSGLPMQLENKALPFFAKHLSAQ